MRYVPFAELEGMPNVIVDGAATKGTVLTLSHWPGSATPPGLEADLSAGMALAYASRLDRHGDADVVSNNHFDQDGLVSIFALVDPAAALARRSLLEDVASAGDFGTYRSRTAARVSMVIAAFADPARSPLGIPTTAYDAFSAAAYTDMLGRLPEMLSSPERYRDLWIDEDATLERSEQLVRSGAVRVVEVPDLDLAIVDVPDDAPAAGGHRFGGQWVSGLHPMAVHNATDRFVILTVRGGHYELACRYETWVQYRSRRPRPRVDLRPLAERFNALDSARWVADGPEVLVPTLRVDDSALAPAVVRGIVEEHLASAPPAWDPYPVGVAAV
ncbi:MAG: DUF6687 family protein [Acidimicrobiales bacterium]